MTGLIILTFVPFLVAIGLLIRLRSERKDRGATEQRMHLVEQQVEGDVLKQREWHAALTHELRSPLAAVLGYSELLEDGALGALDDRSLDAIRRIRYAANHLLQLIEGVEGIALAGQQHSVQPVPVQARALLEEAADALHFDAEARGTSLRVEPADVTFETAPEDAARALSLALGAAIKASPNTTLVLSVLPETPPALVIRGTRIHPGRDHPDNASAAHLDHPLTGAAFRLALARHTAALLGGNLTLEPQDDAVTIVLRLTS